MSHSNKPGSAISRKAEQQLRAHCVALPEVTEDFPWGHRTLKVRKKAFVFMTCDETGLSLSLKLKASHAAARRLPFTSPTGYGLGKAGWVSAQFGPREEPPVELLKRWLTESYRNVAPKTVLKQLDAPTPPKPVKLKSKTMPTKLKKLKIKTSRRA